MLAQSRCPGDSAPDLASADPCSLPADPGWASISRGVLVCDECCSVHRSLGRHISIVKHLRHSAWPPTLLQVRSGRRVPHTAPPPHAHSSGSGSFQGQRPALTLSTGSACRADRRLLRLGSSRPGPSPQLGHLLAWPRSIKQAA